MRMFPITINCPDCSWSRELHEGGKAIDHYCPECGGSTDVKANYKTPDETKTDKI